MAAFELLRIVLQRQISGLCFWLYSPLHAPVVGIHDKKALLVSPAFTWALLLIWVLKAGSWRAAYPCSISQCVLVLELLPRHAHTKDGIWEQRSRFPLRCFLLMQDSAGKMTSATCMVFFSPSFSNTVKMVILPWGGGSALSYQVSLSLWNDGAESGGLEISWTLKHAVLHCIYGYSLKQVDFSSSGVRRVLVRSYWLGWFLVWWLVFFCLCVFYPLPSTKPTSQVPVNGVGLQKEKAPSLPNIY